MIIVIAKLKKTNNTKGGSFSAPRPVPDPVRFPLSLCSAFFVLSVLHHARNFVLSVLHHARNPNLARRERERASEGEQ